MGRYYILRDGEVVEEKDHARWLEWFETAYQDSAQIAETQTAHSTVLTRFLAVNLTLARHEPPQLFETRVVGGWLDGEGEKFCSTAEARAGHASWVARVRSAEEENALPPPGAGW